MTTAGAAAERSDAAREGLLARHPLVFFFIIAYAGVCWRRRHASELGRTTGDNRDVPTAA